MKWLRIINNVTGCILRTTAETVGPGEATE